MLLRWIVRGADVRPPLRRALVDCWRDVSNAGGAVGFPFLPVTNDDVEPATEVMLADVRPDGTRLLVPLDGEDLQGLDHLVLAARGGTGLDDRDDVLMRCDL